MGFVLRIRICLIPTAPPTPTYFFRCALSIAVPRVMILHNPFLPFISLFFLFYCFYYHSIRFLTFFPPSVWLYDYDLRH